MIVSLFRILIVFFFLFPFVLNGQEKEQQRFTILGLGDSITEGGENFQSYLFPLWEKLFTAGYRFDFIGPRASKCRIGTLNHAGFSGKNVEYLDAGIDSIYSKYPADIVLLHAGHNHFDTEKPVPGMIAAYESIIRKIHKTNPDAKILIAQVIPSGKLPKYSYIPELNREITTLVKRINNKNVILVDQSEDFDWKQYTIADMVHPNPAGADKMAGVWFQALQKTLAPSGQVFRPQIVTYKKLGADELKLHIFEPTGMKKKDRCPAIVYFFGGGWTLGTPLQFYRECAYYASKGMVAVAVEYRISWLHQSTPFDSFDDAKDAIRWLRENAATYHIDPGMIAAAGASAGGHLAAATGTIKDGAADHADVGYRPDLLILYYAVVDNSGKGYGSPKMKSRYQTISPLHNITADTPPVLFILGTKDHLVPIETAHEFERKLYDKGVDCELHLFEGAGHPIFYYAKELTDDFYKIRDITDHFLYKYHYLNTYTNP